MAVVEVKVPDIGDFDAVEIIELMVKPGDSVKAEQSLITVESDKASMEIPSSHAGVVKEVKVKIGDTVNQGTVILSLDAQSDTAHPEVSKGPPAAAAGGAGTSARTGGSAQPCRSTSSARTQGGAAPTTAVAPTVASYAGGADIECAMLVLGPGPVG